ncbi:MAG TPA: GNAT family N-acetyltransferase [Vicinamibacterales bacterium]|jgi:ribosomal protein S18 acetylase RimI-like enzyme
MLFATATLAARIERAEYTVARAFAECARARRSDVLIAPVGGAAAIYGGPNQPFNKLAGLGFAEPVDADVLSAIERDFDAREAPVRVELSTLADAAVAPMLTGRGYSLVGFENVLGLGLAPDLVSTLRSAVEQDRTRGIVVSRTTASEAAAWIDTVVTGFEHPDVFDAPPSQESYARAALEETFRDFASIDGLVQYIARRDGAIAGGGAMRFLDGVAQLAGAATLPQHRRRGVQSAVLRARLLDAAASGGDIAVVTTQPGSKSQENVQRAGFTLLYARAILVRPPAPGVHH